MRTIWLVLIGMLLLLIAVIAYGVAVVVREDSPLYRQYLEQQREGGPRTPRG